MKLIATFEGNLEVVLLPSSVYLGQGRRASQHSPHLLFHKQLDFFSLVLVTASNTSLLSPRMQVCCVGAPTAKQLPSPAIPSIHLTSWLIVGTLFHSLENGVSDE